MDLKSGSLLVPPTVKNSSCSHPRYSGAHNFIQHIGITETIEAIVILVLTLGVIGANALVIFVINNRRYAAYIHQQVQDSCSWWSSVWTRQLRCPLRFTNFHIFQIYFIVNAIISNVLSLFWLLWRILHLLEKATLLANIVSVKRPHHRIAYHAVWSAASVVSLLALWGDILPNTGEWELHFANLSSGPILNTIRGRCFMER